ncbi:MAG: ankyrin repeat domain-containing protein [Gammaproteobacteria bacterium]|nr:ankyrin repeat domain-containing protein [Gammaproteobacteria bacterium]
MFLRPNLKSQPKEVTTPLLGEEKTYEPLQDLSADSRKKAQGLQKPKKIITPEKFLKAVDKGDVKTVVAYITQHSQNPEQYSLDVQTREGIEHGKYNIPINSTALHIALYHQKNKPSPEHQQIIIYLLDSGASLYIRDKRGNLPVYLAGECDKEISDLIRTESNKREAAREEAELASILSHGVNAQNETGETALHVAVQRCNKKRIEFLLANGANILIPNKEGQLPSQIALRGYSSLEFVKFLREEETKQNSGVPVQITITEEECIAACHLGDCYTVQLFIEQNKDNPERLNFNTGGQTPLIKATQHNYTDIMSDLLAAGANVDARVKEGIYRGRTALHFAAINCNKDAIKLLLNYGADASLEDSNGKKAEQLVTWITGAASERQAAYLLSKASQKISNRNLYTLIEDLSNKVDAQHAEIERLNSRVRELENKLSIKNIDEASHAADMEEKNYSPSKNQFFS